MRSGRVTSGRSRCCSRTATGPACTSRSPMTWWSAVSKPGRSRARSRRWVTGRPEGGRDLALDLLAADAFVTYAFEAQAEQDVRGLAALADRVAAGQGRKP